MANADFTDRTKLSASENAYDWLSRCIYLSRTLRLIGSSGLLEHGTESDQASIQLQDSTAARTEEIGAKQIHLTLTHTKGTATASVVNLS